MTSTRSFFVHALLLAGIGLMASTASEAQSRMPTVTYVNKSPFRLTVQLVGPSARQVAIPVGQSRTVTASGGRYFTKVSYGGRFYSKGKPFTLNQSARAVSRATFVLFGGNPRPKKMAGFTFRPHTRISQTEYRGAGPVVGRSHARPRRVLARSRGRTESTGSIRP